MERLIPRPLREADGPAIDRITRCSPEAERWSAESCSGYPGWVEETEQGAVAGFLLARIVADELEILNLAVDPEFRRRGTGGRLLRAACEHGRSAGACRVFLEVRESNRVARLFYERHGFAAAGRRPRYYRDPEEDALVMARALFEARRPG